MKKIAVVLLCLVALGLSVFAQSGRTRQRVVVTDNLPSSQNNTSTPNQNPQNSGSTANPSQTQTKRPPVLTGNTTSPTTAPKPTNTPAVNDKDLGVIEDDDVIKVETSLVTMPVTVLDRNGRFIPDLQKGDFQVYEDGVAQKLEYFASVEQPFTVVLLIDVSNSTAFKIDEIQNAAIAFIDQLRQDDKVMVVSFDEKVRVLSPPTNNRSQLRNAIMRLDFGGGTSLYDAVHKAISEEISKIDGRKAIVLFTDGVDTTSRNSSYESTVREAEEIDAMIYPIRFDTSDDMNGGYGGGGGRNGGGYPRRGGNGGGGVLGAILGGVLNGGGNVRIGGGGGGGVNSGDYEKGRRYLLDLAQTSGGRNFDARSVYNLETAFSGIAEELRRQYSIGYYPENAGQAGQRKQVSVRVARSNMVVRAKNSYIVGDKSTTATTKKPAQSPTMKNNGRLPF